MFRANKFKILIVGAQEMATKPATPLATYLYGHITAKWEAVNIIWPPGFFPSLVENEHDIYIRIANPLKLCESMISRERTFTRSKFSNLGYVTPHQSWSRSVTCRNKIYLQRPRVTGHYRLYTIQLYYLPARFAQDLIAQIISRLLKFLFELELIRISLSKFLLSWLIYLLGLERLCSF